MAIIRQIYVPMEKTMNTEEIIAAIYNNQMSEKYLEWRDYDNEYVQMALAEIGQFPDYYRTSKNPNIRAAVYRNHPEYINDILDDPKELFNVRTLFDSYSDIAIDHLKRHLATNDNLQDDDVRKRDSRRFRVKLAAKEHVATTLERTMDALQLYNAGSPLWARGFNTKHIGDIIDAQYLINKYNLDKNRIDVFFNPNLSYYDLDDLIYELEEEIEQ